MITLRCVCGCRGPFRPRPHMREWLRRMTAELYGPADAALVPAQWQCPRCGTDASMLHSEQARAA